MNIRIRPALIIAPLLLASSSVFAQSSVFHAYAIINNWAGKCVDVPQTIPTPTYFYAQLWTCAYNPQSGYPPNQAWRPVGIGKDGEGDWDTFIFKDPFYYRCLSVENNSTANAAKVIVTECEDSNPSQAWIRTKKMDYHLYFETTTKWVNVRSGKCLDAYATFNGVQLQQYDCAGGRWGPQDFSAANAGNY